MKRIYTLALPLLASLITSTLTTTASANGSYSSGYIAVDGSALSVSNSTVDDVNPRGIRFRLGVQVSEVFDIEAHVGGASVNELDEFDEFSAAYLGLFLKAYQPIGRSSALYVLGGGSSVNLTQTINDVELSNDSSGFSYGFGLETQLNRALDISADFVRYARDDGESADVSAFNLGIKWYF